MATELGANCATACATKDHRSFGECLRGFSILGEANAREKAWDKELSDYAQARKDGINPAGTTQKHVDNAVRVSHELGRAYDATARVRVEP
jgi:hypothetical protein